MLNKKDNVQELCSSFYVEARLTGNMLQVRRILNSIPSLRLLSHGTRLRYEIVDESGHKQTLELEENGIRLVFRFEKPDEDVFSSNLLRLFALLSILDSAYEIELRSIYGYVVDVLRKSSKHFATQADNSALVERLSRNVESLTFANSKLSHIVYENARYANAIESDLKSCKSFCFSVIDSAGRRGRDVKKDIEGTFGVSPDIASRVLQLVKKGD